MDSMNWRKSSYSGANGGNCVEVRKDAIRDSKNPDTELPISTQGLRSLLNALKRY